MSKIFVAILCLMLVAMLGLFLYRLRKPHRINSRLINQIKTRPAPAINPTPDEPINFGYKTSWFAIRGAESKDIVDYFSMGTTPITSGWGSGMMMQEYTASSRLALKDFTSGGLISVTPKIGEWTLIECVSIPSFGFKTFPDHLSPVLISLSKRFHTVFFFGSHRSGDYYSWAIAKDGNIERAFMTVDGEIMVDRGAITDEEKLIGFPMIFNGASPEAKNDQYWKRTDLRHLNESDVIKLAERWSVDPQSMESKAPNPSTVWLINVVDWKQLEQTASQ